MMKILPPTLGLAAWIVFPIILARAAAGSPDTAQKVDNLLADPGFEQEAVSSHWVGNNWAGNDVEFIRDAVDPHSGAQSEHVTLRRVTGTAPSVQLSYRNLPLKPGMSLQLRFWLRGLPNTKPITVSLRQTGTPYKVYFSADVALVNNWSESVFNLTLPADLSTEDTSLIFDLKEENTFWVDDVSLSELPAVSADAPLVGNQVKNGSFEVGKDHWYATFRESHGLRSVNQASQNNVRANLTVLSDPSAPDGHRVLSFEVFPACRIMLTSAFFHLRYGHPVSVNFWLKSSASNAPFTVILGSGKYPMNVVETNKCTISDERWKFYHVLVTPKPSTCGTYYLEFGADQPGNYALDAVSVVEGDVSDPAYPQGEPSLGWNAPEGTPAGNLFYRGDQIHFALHAATRPGAQTTPVRLRLLDYRQRELRRWTSSIQVDAHGFGSTDVELPSDRQGGFKVEASFETDAVGMLPRTELIYSVVPRLKPPADGKDSFFGGHVDLTPYNLAIAERVGFRWLRLHVPLFTKWMVVEPEPGKFDFYTQSVALARARGFHLLGSFDTTPWFYADGPPDKTRQSHWYDSFAPKDWNAWRTYVQKTAAAFGPYITDWEIWNEPDGGFLQVPPGEDKAKVYVKILRQTRQALDKAGFHFFLVGNAVAHLDGAFTWSELSLGGGKEVDALSFHYYGEDSGAEEKRPALNEQLNRMRQFPNRSGAIPELWDTEGGIWLNGGHSWLDSAEIPPSAVTKVEDAANTIVRVSVGMKAMGVKRHFHYSDYAAPSGGIDYREGGGMVETNGIVQPAGAAHAAAVYFLDDAMPIAFEEKSVGDKRVVFARFRTTDSNITVLWARRPVELGQIEEMEWKDASGFEMMGNPLSLSSQTEVNLNPIYLIRRR